MAAQIPVKAIYSGSDVTSLGEFASSDSITATYLPVGTGSSDVAAGDHTHAYLPLAGGTLTGNLVTTGLIDGRDVAADGVLATNAMPKSGGAFTGAITTNSTIDTVDIATILAHVVSIMCSSTLVTMVTIKSLVFFKIEHYVAMSVMI